jgi:hypothetical protein
VFIRPYDGGEEASYKSGDAMLTHRKESFTPYQLIIATFTFLYAFRHLDDLLGFSGE